MVIRTGPERVSNDESPKLGGDLDLNNNAVTNSGNELLLKPQGASTWDILPTDSSGDDAGVTLSVFGGTAGGATTGGAGGSVKIIGGDAAGSGDNDGGGIAIYPGSPTGSGKGFGIQLWNQGATENAVWVHDGTDLQTFNMTANGGFAFLDNSLAELFFFDGAAVNYAGRMLDNQGADVASANDLTLGGDGNTFEITGTTQINRIVNTNWQNGSKVTLLFTSTPTVKYNQASAGANIIILLAGAVDFVASAGDTLTLMLCEIGGTQAWREVARAVI